MRAKREKQQTIAYSDGNNHPDISAFSRYIPHDNIHEINTWKCPIQTDCG